MNRNQMDLIRSTLEVDLVYLENVQDILKKYNDFRIWFKTTIEENIEMHFVMKGPSKKSIQNEFKNKIDMSSKDLGKLLITVDSGSSLMNKDFNNVPINGNRIYKIDEEHRKFNKLMLSIGLMDSVLNRCYILSYSGQISFNDVVTNKKLTLDSTKCIKIYRQMINIDSLKIPQTFHDFISYVNVVKGIHYRYDLMEQNDIDSLKCRILRGVQKK